MKRDSTIKRVVQAILLACATPLLAYSMFYFGRFVLTGHWYEGGGVRAMLGFFAALFIFFVMTFVECEP